MFSKDKLMASASNPDVLQFSLKEKNHTGHIPTKDHLYSNSPCEDTFQACDKAFYSAVLKSWSWKIETLPKLCTFHQVGLTKAYQDQVLATYLIQPPTENLSKENSGEKDSILKGNPMVKNANFHGKPLPKVPAFRRGEKIKQENLRPSVPVTIKEPFNDHVRTSPTTPSNNIFHSSQNYYKFNRPLKEALPVLEDWAKRGLDIVLNRHAIFFSSEQVGTFFEKDLKYGLDVTKGMCIRMFTLMTAADRLTESDPVLISEFKSICIDLNESLIMMWSIMENIDLQIKEDFKSIKLACNNISGRDTENTKERAKSNDFIINAYNVAIEKLPLLRKQLADIREKLCIICSKVEKLR